MVRTLNFYDSAYSSDNFVGARIFETKVDFYFPLGMAFDTNDISSCQKKAYEVLSVISSAPISDAKLGQTQNSASKIANPFNSFIWILNDYFKNGLYNLKRKQLVSDYNGKINWKRTFNDIPLISGEDLVYLHPLAEKISAVDTIITTIHKYCIKQSILKIGWLFSIEDDGRPFNLSEPEKIYFKHVLLRELRYTFEDRRKMLLMHMLRVLDNSIGGSAFLSRSELGTYEFHQVWEYMIQEVYGNLPLEQFFPSAIWHLIGREPFKSSSLRPDTVLEYDGTLFILDAKYYKYGALSGRSEGSLPTSDSIQKQITYGDHAALKMSKRFPSGIRNAFVVPFCSTDDERPLEYAGFATAGWRDTNRTDDMDYRKVHLLLLDTEYLMKKYQSGRKDLETVKTLVSCILSGDN